MVLAMARSRGRLGAQGTRGDSMLADLRDRLRAHGELPALPPGSSAEMVLRSAGGASFSGDFIVANRSDDARFLELALVDVSGKGVDAGTRSLLLSGARTEARAPLFGVFPEAKFVTERPPRTR